MTDKHPKLISASKTRPNSLFCQLRILVFFRLFKMKSIFVIRGLEAPSAPGDSEHRGHIHNNPSHVLESHSCPGQVALISSNLWQGWQIFNDVISIDSLRSPRMMQKWREKNGERIPSTPRDHNENEGIFLGEIGNSQKSPFPPNFLSPHQQIFPWCGQEIFEESMGERERERERALWISQLLLIRGDPPNSLLGSSIPPSCQGREGPHIPHF